MGVCVWSVGVRVWSSAAQWQRGGHHAPSGAACRRCPKTAARSRPGPARRRATATRLAACRCASAGPTPASARRSRCLPTPLFISFPPPRATAKLAQHAVERKGARRRVMALPAAAGHRRPSRRPAGPSRRRRLHRPGGSAAGPTPPRRAWCRRSPPAAGPAAGRRSPAGRPGCRTARRPVAQQVMVGQVKGGSAALPTPAAGGSAAHLGVRLQRLLVRDVLVVAGEERGPSQRRALGRRARLRRGRHPPHTRWRACLHEVCIDGEPAASKTQVFYRLIWVCSSPDFAGRYSLRLKV